MSSNDPAFEAKAADVIGLYLNPPAHAAVFCVDREDGHSGAGAQGSAAAAGARSRPESRLKYKHKRNGTLSLFAALNTATGEALGMTAHGMPARSSWPS
jgi:hypothetical protein